MKYIAKGFVITDTKKFETFWTKEIFVFNELLWKNGYRTFQPCRRLQQGMSYNRIHDSSVWGHTGESELKVILPLKDNDISFGRDLRFRNGYRFGNKININFLKDFFCFRYFFPDMGEYRWE
jgi:hypothetical protein